MTRCAGAVEKKLTGEESGQRSDFCAGLVLAQCWGSEKAERSWRHGPLD